MQNMQGVEFPGIGLRTTALVIYSDANVCGFCRVHEIIGRHSCIHTFLQVLGNNNLHKIQFYCLIILELL